jgi:AcrR family transcriptional regulator
MTAYVRLSPDERKAQLLSLGIRLFTERPYDDFSMDDVAAEAGVSKGLLYHYFPSKRLFYVEALRGACAEMLSLTEPDTSLETPAEQLTVGLDAYLAYVADHSAAYRAILRGGIGTDPEVAAVTEDIRRVMMKRILLGIGITSPRPRVRVAVKGWIGMVEAASIDWLDHQDLSREQLVRMLMAALTGLLSSVSSRG